MSFNDLPDSESARRALKQMHRLVTVVYATFPEGVPFPLRDALAESLSMLDGAERRATADNVVSIRPAAPISAAVGAPDPVNDLVVIRRSQLEGVLRAVESLKTSESSEGCQDDLTVVDGRHLKSLDEGISGLATRPILECLHRFDPAGENLEPYLIVSPPEMSREQVQELIVATAEEALAMDAAGYESDNPCFKNDPGTDAFFDVLHSKGLGWESGIASLEVGCYDVLDEVKMPGRARDEERSRG